ncbi:MAG: asparaginase [Solirubrobacteraceae bacterium]
MTDQRRPRVAVLTMGGTIASMPGDDVARGVSPRLAATDLVAAIHGIDEVAELEAVSFRQVPSSDLTLDDLIELQRTIRERIAAGCAGVVVAQGTDSLEETAFTLDLLNDMDATIVVTGAMRNPTLLGADGLANLLAAIRVAASAECRGLGCVVVFNDEIHAGRYVRKTHTTSLATFRSPTVGALGWIGEAVPRLALRPVHRRWLPVETLGAIPPVALVTLGPGEDGRLLRAVPDCGYHGLVVEALGGGHVPARLVDELEALAGRIPVALTSRTGSGEVLRHTYGFTGSEGDLLRRGLIWAGALDGPKARVLLALALAAGADRAGVIHAFHAFGVPNAGMADGAVKLQKMRPHA